MFNSFVILCVCFINQLTLESFVLHPAFHQSSNVNGVSLDLQACRKSEIIKPLQYTLTNQTIIRFDGVFFPFKVQQVRVFQFLHLYFLVPFRSCRSGLVFSHGSLLSWKYEIPLQAEPVRFLENFGCVCLISCKIVAPCEMS